VQDAQLRRGAEQEMERLLRIKQQTEGRKVRALCALLAAAWLAPSPRPHSGRADHIEII
jgi:hypothetical protein